MISHRSPDTRRSHVCHVQRTIADVFETCILSRSDAGRAEKTATPSISCIYRRLPNTLIMALSSSPRKVVPLALGADWQPVPKPNPTGPVITKRVFYCGVVVENSENGRRLPQGMRLVIPVGP